MFKSILLVGIGGFFGSILRYLISYYLGVKTLSAIPYGTLTVNVLGSFFLGVIIGFTWQDSTTTGTRLFLATGFCGGFTTFSTFSYEFFLMLQDGHIHAGMLYMFFSVVSGLLAVWCGYLLMIRF